MTPRDRAIFVGEPDDIVPHDFGPGLPSIRAWTEEHYDFPGYVTGFDPAAFADREIRHRLGYRHDERVCIVTVGGSGVGGHLLRRVIDALPHAQRLVPDLRMIVVAGPRIDPATLPSHPGLEIRPYVHELYRHLAVCDLAVVQGGLTTAMELTASSRPFIAIPLRHHFEQNFHVAPLAALRRRAPHGLRRGHARRACRSDQRGTRTPGRVPARGDGRRATRGGDAGRSGLTDSGDQVRRQETVDFFSLRVQYRDGRGRPWLSGKRP